MPEKLTRAMAAPKTTTLSLKLRTTGEIVDAEIKLLSATEMAAAFRKLGIKSASELLHLKDKFDDLKMIEFLESVSAQALSVSERWTVNDVRNTLDVEQQVKILNALNQSLPQKAAGKPQMYG
jgi:hypothetical protein